jgi:catechol 2,3-dioxygenase-like lactoylglutathione lyase family enzyme
MSTYAKSPLSFSVPTDVSALAVRDAVRLRLHGVHHSARPTWKLTETVRFYRDILGLPLVHCITARGWGRQGHPDFLHFFFDAGRGSLIAFFYYLGTPRPDDMRPEDEVLFRATHISWRVETRDELVEWKRTLEGRGIDVSPISRHEVIESIYFADPNGYPLEVSFHLRELDGRDALDADVSLQAAMDLEAAARDGGTPFRSVDACWHHKAELLEKRFPTAASGRHAIELYVLDVPEFRSLVDAARGNAACEVELVGEGYARILSDVPLTFERRALGLKPAVWYGLFTAGLRGRVAEFGRDSVRIEPETLSSGPR